MVLLLLIQKQKLYEVVPTMRDDNLKKSKVCNVVINDIKFICICFCFCVVCYVLFCSDIAYYVVVVVVLVEAFMAENSGQEMVQY